MTVRTLSLSHRIDELLATTDPFAVHESVTSYLHSIEEPVLRTWLLLSVPALDEQSCDALHEELVEKGDPSTLPQAIEAARKPGELANSVSRFLSHEPRAMAGLAPPLLAGYLAHIASLEGGEPPRKIHTRILAGVGVATLGLLLFLHSLGTANRTDTPPSEAPLQSNIAGMPAGPSQSLRVTHAPNALAHRRFAVHPRKRARFAVKRRGKAKRFAIASRLQARHHRKHHPGSAAVWAKKLRRSGPGILATHHFSRRGRHGWAHRTPRKRRVVASTRRAATPVFHGIFKPFRWVLFKPVHHAPG